jgi:hypothetical protein
MRTLLLVVIMLAMGPVSNGDPTPSPALPKKIDWKEDPACRLVFHAVLEGLYEDGVSDDVVNNIIPKDKEGREKMKRSFVLDCPLCQPAFEAFCVYQSRPKFSDGSLKSTFGKGFDEKIQQGLMSDSTSTRLIALRTPIREWVERRLKSMKLEEPQRERWWKEINDRSNSGTATLRDLIRKDPDYKNWSGYWGCAACLGSCDACKVLKLGKE